MMTMTKSPYGGPAMARAALNSVKRPSTATAPYPGTPNPMGAQMGPKPAPPPATSAAPAPAPAAPAFSGVSSAEGPVAAGPVAGMGAMAAAARKSGGGGRNLGGDGQRDNPYEDWQRFDPRNPKQWQKYMMRTNLKDYFRAYPWLWEQIGNLREQANTNRFDDEGRAQFLAPYMQNIEQQTGQAQSALDQAMGERGLTDSSANALGQSNILSRASAARASAVQDLYKNEEARQQMAQQQLMQQLQGLSGRGMGNAQDLGSLIMQLRQQALLQGRQQGDDNLFGDLFGGLGGLVGMASGLGWQPLR